MRTMFYGFMLSAALVASGGCKKSSTEKAGQQVQKTQEKVNEEKRDLSRDTNKAEKQQGDLTRTTQQLERARADYNATAKERLARDDDKINNLAHSSDPKAQQAASTLRERADQLKAKLDKTGQETAAGWDQYKNGIEHDFDTLEKDIDNAK